MRPWLLAKWPTVCRSIRQTFWPVQIACAMWWLQQVSTSPVGDREIQSPARQNPYRQVDDRQQLRRVRHEHLVKQALVALLQPHEISMPASKHIPNELMVLWSILPLMCRCHACKHAPGCRCTRMYLTSGLRGDIKGKNVLLSGVPF